LLICNREIFKKAKTTFLKQNAAPLFTTILYNCGHTLRQFCSQVFFYLLENFAKPTHFWRKMSDPYKNAHYLSGNRHFLQIGMASA